jgi:hypothetical protein
VHINAILFFDGVYNTIPGSVLVADANVDSILAIVDLVFVDAHFRHLMQFVFHRLMASVHLAYPHRILKSDALMGIRSNSAYIFPPTCVATQVVLCFHVFRCIYMRANRRF